MKLYEMALIRTRVFAVSKPTWQARFRVSEVIPVYVNVDFRVGNPASSALHNVRRVFLEEHRRRSVKHHASVKRLSKAFFSHCSPSTMKTVQKPGRKFWKGTTARAALCSLTLSVLSASSCLGQGLVNSSDFSDANANETAPALRGQMQPGSSSSAFQPAVPGSTSKPPLDDPPDFNPNAKLTPLSKNEIKRAERNGTSERGTERVLGTGGAKASEAPTNRVEAPSVNAEILDVIAKQPLDLPNFFMVNRGLLRGGQPTAQGVRLLKAAGVRSVINLRTEDIPIQRERDMVEGSGMKFISMPTYLVEEPTLEQFKHFIAAVQNPANQPVYVHCQQGRDRTGTMIGAYRVACNGWKADAAFSEMYDKGFRPGFAPLMRGFYGFAQKYDKNAKAPTGEFIVKDLKTRFDRMRGKGQVPSQGRTEP